LKLSSLRNKKKKVPRKLNRVNGPVGHHQAEQNA
jgi:hypothetical protein